MKKMSWLLVVFFLSASFASAQNSASSNDAPKISVGKYKWFRQKRLPRFGIGMGGNPMPVENDNNAPVIQPNMTLPNNGIRELFIYEAEFKNESGRELKGFVWEYIFLNSDGSEELDRHEFLYPYKIGKNKKISARNELTLPPTPVINADDAKKSTSPYVERVEIRCVIFEDDSIWKRPNASENACQKLGSIIRQREERNH